MRSATRCAPWLPLLALALALAGPPPAAAQPLTDEWIGKWRADLAFAADSLPQQHANFFHRMTREDYRVRLDSLSARLPKMAQHEVVVALARIIVGVGDGHTRVTFPFHHGSGVFTGHATTAGPQIPGLVFRQYPVRFGLFGDSLWVTHTTAADRALLGGRVVRLGRLPAGEAMAAVMPTIQRDNDNQVRSILPSWLGCPEVLAACGVVDDREHLVIEVEHAGGRRVTRTLTPGVPGAVVVWLEARAPGPEPWAERLPDRAHWITALPGTKAIYARYREVRDDEVETIAQFADSLMAVFEATGAERIVLDLRGNSGGDGTLNHPLVKALVRNRRLDELGTLWALIDRGTFSAAVMMAVDLETWTNAILVGEKTGGGPNSYGDSRRIVLPNSGITVRVSSLYWQLTDPRDERDGVTPHLAMTESYADWQARRDPVLEVALAGFSTAAPPAGNWRGIVGYRNFREVFELSVAADSAWVSIPGFGIERVPLGSVARTSGRLAGAFEVGPREAQLEVIEVGDRLAGIVAYRGRRLPVVLERAR